MRTFYKPLLLISAVILLMLINNAKLIAQVKIGNHPDAINTNSILELESSTKGFLAPRVALNDLNSPAPLTTPITEGMLVYSYGGSVTNGFYYWRGNGWVKEATGRLEQNMVTKTAVCTLTKDETFVMANNDITLTLPAITSADDGLAITIKNTGSYKDLVIVNGSNGAMIDNEKDVDLTRWVSQTFIASNGNWLKKFFQNKLDNVFLVDSGGSFESVKEVLEFLNAHMEEPSIVLFCGGTFTIDQTQVVDLPYAVTFEGTTFGATTLIPASGLAGSPMFKCLSDCSFKMIVFDATSLPGYGTQPGEDCIHFDGNDTYNEIKDATISGFYNGIVDNTNAQLWIFEDDFDNCHGSAMLLQGSVPGVYIEVGTTGFYNNRIGFNMSSGSSAYVEIVNTSFDNAYGTDSAIVYDPSSFSFEHLNVSTDSWNYTGSFISGFDFTRSDGRDADAFIEQNVGENNYDPFCKINVVNNADLTMITNPLQWTKANWTNTSSHTCKWTIANNRITYQSRNKKDGWAVISGNMMCDQTGPVEFCLIKDGVISTIYGRGEITLTTINQPFQFSTVVYLPDIAKNDYFELYCRSINAGANIKFKDVQWFTNTR